MTKLAKEVPSCIYCLSKAGPPTIDHVIPRSFYPDSTPPNQAKWKAPCCSKCNNRYSKIEKEILEKLGLCLNPDDITARGVAQRAVRAFRPSLGKSLKDKASRARRRESILKDSLELSGIPLRGILPRFGPPAESTEGPLATVKIHHSMLEVFGVKLIKGLLYVTGGFYLDSKFRITCKILTEQGDSLMNRDYGHLGTIHELAPGISATIALSEQPPAGLFRFQFWNKLVLHGTVISEEDARRLGEEE
jgi:hypothetical protein